ncbi:DUF2911 domain-containing protein [Pedobacter antarcticus]|uniref:DUF2911 domain-containing protein n=1 Tax=Pedobacter antarcticus TaxID=34086 RepID=UPI00292F77E4|nr:DUF2911 domain-containing protein [Pedobacter antarcticus]
MKKITLLAVTVLFAITTKAQQFKFRPLDISQADFAYFPARSVKESVGDKATPLIKIVYSRPSAKGRKVFGSLQPFGKVWRIGANESTEIRFFKNVVLGGKKIAAGTYTLFAIPEKEKWEMILNQQTDTWGPYGYDQTKDVIRFTVQAKQLTEYVETLGIVFTPQPSGANLIIGWENTYVEVPITINN